MLRLIFEVIKIAVTLIGLFFGTCLVLGKSGPFRRTADKIDRKNRRNAQRYLYN